MYSDTSLELEDRPVVQLEHKITQSPKRVSSKPQTEIQNLKAEAPHQESSKQIRPSKEILREERLILDYDDLKRRIGLKD